MKSHLSFFLFLALIFASCGAKLVEHEISYQCRLVNRSSHVIRVELNGNRQHIASPQTLERGASFGWSTYATGGFAPLTFRDTPLIKITFDDVRQLVYMLSTHKRNPYWGDNYVLTVVDRYNYNAVFTFTDADYDAAEEISTAADQ